MSESYICRECGSTSRLVQQICTNGAIQYKMECTQCLRATSNPFPHDVVNQLCDGKPEELPTRATWEEQGEARQWT